MTADPMTECRGAKCVRCVFGHVHRTVRKGGEWLGCPGSEERACPVMTIDEILDGAMELPAEERLRTANDLFLVLNKEMPPLVKVMRIAEGLRDSATTDVMARITPKRSTH